MFVSAKISQNVSLKLRLFEKIDMLMFRGARYEWWTGAGKPWVADDSKAAKHFEYHHMIGAPHTFYNAGLKRYILPNYGSVNSNTK